MNGDSASVVSLASADSGLGRSATKFRTTQSLLTTSPSSHSGSWAGKPPTGRTKGLNNDQDKGHSKGKEKEKEEAADTMAFRDRWKREDSLSNRYTADTSSMNLLNSSFDSPLSLRSPRRSLHESLTDSPSRSPIRAVHDLNLTSLPLGLDTDSGIGNTVTSNRYRHNSGYSAPPHAYHNGDTSLSLDLSPRRYAQSESGQADYLRNNGPVHNVFKALDQSEERRHLLVDKLKDARGTMQQQVEKLTECESSIKDAAFEVEDLRYREKEYKRKINALEQERYDFQSMRIENLRLREDMQEKIESLDLELRTVRSSYAVLEQEGSKKHGALEQATNSRFLLEEENNKLLGSKESLTKEISALKESLEIARSRNNWLEKQSKDIIAELEELRHENQTLSAETKNSSRSVSSMRDENLRLKEDNSAIQSEIHALSEEKHRFVRQSDAMQDVIADLQATLASTAADKERFFQEKLDLHQRVQNLMYDKECLSKEKNSLEDQVHELNSQLAGVKTDMGQWRDERTGMEEELAAVKKVSEVLSLELAGTKTRLEKTLEQTQSLEQTKKIAFQQHELYEQEIKSLEQQIDNTKKSMTALQRDHQREKDSVDEQTSKLKEELRQLKTERTRMETKAHEMEARLKQAEQNLKEHSDMQLRELDGWQSNCEKMTATLARKETEVQTLTKKIQELEEEANHLKVDHHSYQSQQDELEETKEEISRIQEENRRLLQERAENQQVIQLLEMQKSILAKASEGALTRVHDSEQQQTRIDELIAENNLLEDRVRDLETVRDTLIKEKEERLASGDLFLGKTPDAVAAKVQDLETKNLQLRESNSMVTEKLTKMEKENLQLKKQQEDVVPRAEHRRLQREKSSVSDDYQRLKSQYNQLEETYHSSLSSRKHRLNSDLDDGDLSSLRHEKGALESQLGMLKSQVVLLENGKKRAEDNVHKMEKQVEDLQQKVFDSSHKDTTQVISLQKQVNQLQSELDGSKTMVAKQEAVIHALREDLDEEKTGKPTKLRQSLDDVGEELNHMRTELHKLMEVIQVKDQEIEGLEGQLQEVKRLATEREQQLENLRVGGGEASYGSDDAAVIALRKERQELTEQLCKVGKERDRAMRESNQNLEDMKNMYEEDIKKLQERLRRELSSRDRQIESLEEQLRHSTKIEIKKLKRDASKVELLKAENRRLQSELTKPKLPSEKTDTDEENGAPTWLKSTQAVDKPITVTADDNDVDDEPETYASWDNDSVHEDIIYSESSPADLPKNLSQELAQAERRVHGQMQRDEDVKNVVNLLENVSLSSSMDYPSDTNSRSPNKAGSSSRSPALEKDRRREGQSQSQSQGGKGSGSFSAPWRSSQDEGRDNSATRSSTKFNTSQQNGRPRSASADCAPRGRSPTPRPRGFSTGNDSASAEQRDAGTMTPKRKYDPARPSSSAATPKLSLASRLRAENSESLAKVRSSSYSSVSSTSSVNTVVRVSSASGSRDRNRNSSPSSRPSTPSSRPSTPVKPRWM